MRVLVVRLGAFGDIIHTLPLAADLRAAGHQVGWLCEDRWGDLLADQAVDHRHLVPRAAIRSGPWSARISALRRCVREIRAQRYDAVIDAQGLAKSALLGWASGAALRIGHDWPNAREGSWLLNRRRAPSSRHHHIIDQQRALARGLGVIPNGPWRWILPRWQLERAQAGEWLEQQGVARPWLLNVGAGWPTKVWPSARQVALVHELKRLGRPLVALWGTPAEHQAALALIEAAGYGQVAPPTTIPHLAGMISQAELMISGDTGPLHLAFALGTPAVGLFGPVPASRNGPCGVGYRSLQAPAAPWERHDLSRVDMGAISVAQVLEAAEQVRAERAGTAAPRGA
jgi:heptosyltransferase-1